jgi:hypothetical protein
LLKCKGAKAELIINNPFVILAITKVVLTPNFIIIDEEKGQTMKLTKAIIAKL